MSATIEPIPAGAGPMPRIGLVDVARGLAVVAMIAYHAAWDLGQLQLVETDISRQPGWLLFARIIAASFLTLVGVGLALAHRDGVRPRAFLKRLAVLVAAALAVTVATALAFPDSYIFFGILHNIALSSVLALPLVRAPALVSALAAAALFGAAWIEAPALFDEPMLAFLGLGGRVPTTNDWVPVVPWTGFVFAGIALIKAGAMRASGADLLPGGRVGQGLAWLGRHSLAVYLLHQPVLYGALWLVLQGVGPNPVAEAAPFTRACLTGCRARGGTVESCQRGCGCAVDALKRDGLWATVVRGRPSAEEVVTAQAVTRRCLTVDD